MTLRRALGPSGPALSILVAFAASGPARADKRFEDDLKRAFTDCRVVADVEQRVACYDKLSDRLTPPTWQGRLGLQTDLFEIDRPTIVRFESEGVIFVMYLKDERGEIVQNLHIGGGGEDTYLIEKPGKYSLNINGAEGWRVWLQPQP